MSSPDRRPSEFRAWFVWSLGALAFAYGFFMRVSPSVMVDDLMRDFSVGAAVLGNLSAIYLYVYAGLQIPIGAMMDRWGPRLMITSSIAIAGLGAALFATAATVDTAYVGRFLIGLGSGCAFVGSLILAGRWFAPRRFAFLSGMTMFAGMAGGILGQAPLAQLLTVTDWRTALMGSAAFAGLLAVATWFAVRDHPPDAHDGAREMKVSGRVLLRNMALALASLRVWIVALAAAALTGPLLAFGGLWGVPYLMERYGLDRPEAASFVTFNLIGFAIGAPAGGWISDFIGRRKAPLLAASTTSIVCLTLMIYVDMPLAVTSALIFVLGLMSGAMVVTFALAREITPPGIHGAVTGFINTGAVGAGALLQPFIGYVLDRNWDGAMAGGVRAYSVDTYHTAFLTLIGWAVMGLICVIALRETYCRPAAE